LREIALVFDGDGERNHVRLQLAYYTAYQAGVYSQEYKRFPKYDPPKKQKSGRSSGVQTPEQQRMIAMSLNAVFGGRFIKRGDS
tara:strand:- start:1164 stop:1415 length:252 start_codon:yes stop_codon:yes gene_type:complete